MVRKRLYVYECPACGGSCHALRMLTLGGKVREPFRDRDGRLEPGVEIRRVLCWWCRTYHDPAEVTACMALPEKKATAESSTSSTSSVSAPGLLSQFTELWAFLTATSYPDGRSRMTGRISLSFDAGLLGLLLQDDQTGQYAFLNGRGLDDLLLEAETRLADGSLAWRASRFQPRKRGR